MPLSTGRLCRRVALLAPVVLAAGTLAAGSASGLGGLGVRTLGVGDAPVLPCSADGLAVRYETTRDEVTGVRLAALERTDCPTAAVSVALRDVAGRGLAESAQRVLSPGAEQVGLTFGTPPSADLVRGATVQLLTRPGPRAQGVGAGVRLPLSAPRLTVARTHAAVPVETCVLGASADASVDQVLPMANFAEGPLRVFAPALTSRRHAYLRFDLSDCGMPSGAVVKSAVLSLWLEDAPGTRRTHVLARAGSAWTESGVTWASQPSALAPSAQASTGTVPGRRLEWDVRSDVALWSAGLAANQGWRLADADLVLLAATAQYASREHPQPDRRPLLTITYRA